MNPSPHIEMPEYDYSMPMLFGGPIGNLNAATTGNYRVRSPWNSPCEIRMISSTFIVAGVMFVTDADLTALNPLTLAVGSTLPQDGIRGFVVSSNTPNTTVPFAMDWIPWYNLGGMITNSTAYLCVQFRRVTKVRRFFPGETVPAHEGLHAEPQKDVNKSMEERLIHGR